MLKNTFSVLAEFTMRDAESANFSAVNILENVAAEGFPAFMPKVSFLTYWRRDAEDPSTNDCVVTVSLSGKELIKQPVQLDFQGKLRTRLNMNFQGLVLPGAGDLTFTAQIAGGPSASLTLPVEAKAKSASN